ncbi:MAG: insulinase family protein [Bacteroidales bacterium]|nr:insulinase family protein [Bacteroidales bacterium]
MELVIHTLRNGIRLIHQPTQSPVSHCGVIMNTGSRDEADNEHGLAHFIEHMIFKGTKNRKAHHILSRMEDVGGDINAYTTKEETCLHASFYNNYYDRAFELMSDILIHSSFPANEIRKEKDVILDEINSYKDSPIDLLYDDFEEMVFNTHPIARNILGDEKKLGEYTRQHLLNFYRKHYSTHEMIVSSVGSISPKRVINYFEKYFTVIPERKTGGGRLKYDEAGYRPRHEQVSKSTYQAHCILGNQAYGHTDKKRLALHLLNNILCGSGMNSRLNIALREKRGLAYNIESNYTTYSDTGIINIYFGSDREDIGRCIDVSLREIRNIREKALGSIQLSRAKKQLIGQIAIATENYEHQMIANGRSLLIYGHVDSLKEISDKINRVHAGEILEVANEIFQQDELSQLIFN